MRSAANAARAALAPHAPWTPPPGWADADARKRPRTGVSARPSPGTGRNTSLLRQRGRAAAERAARQVGVARLQRGRAEHVPTGDQARGTPARALDLGLDPVGERLDLGGVPLAGEVAAGVAARTRSGHVGVRPHGLGAGRRAGRVGLVHLPDEHERARGDAVLGEVGRVPA